MPIEFAGTEATRVRLFYRHVDQAETYESVNMTGRDNVFKAAIPAAYTQSPYPLEYYFEVHTGTSAGLFPGIGSSLMQQPYFTVRRG